MYFHPDYCHGLGHRDAKSKDCLMNNNSVNERNTAAIAISNESVEKELEPILKLDMQDICMRFTCIPIIFQHTSIRS